MKIFKIFYYCFLVLFLALVIWPDDDAPIDPFYWIIVKLAIWALLTFGMAFIRRRDKSIKESKLSSILFLTFWILYGGYFLGYKEIIKYNRNVCQDRFGLPFNKQRQILGVPQIPTSWHIDFREDKSVNWQCKKGDSIGHVSKDIFIDSVCRDEFERDDYNFKPIKGFSPHLSIRTYYTFKKVISVDSIIYNYESTYNQYQSLSRQQADSLFAAEKIIKDY